VRAAYRAAALDEPRARDFVAAVQARFREWLGERGGLREVYDLARLERAEAAAGGGGSR
jgi:TBCC domain-containing protein 1